MFRKVLGIVTAGVAGLLLVGVAWAAGDQTGDISSSGSEGTTASSQGTTGSSEGTTASSQGTTASSQGTTASTSGTAATSTSVDGTTPTSNGDGSTSTSVDDNSTTSISLVDTSSTSTSVPNSSTSTTVDDTTSTSVDDNDREETRGPAPVDMAPTTYEVGAAGFVTVQITGGRLILLDVSASSGWQAIVDRDDGEEVRVEFESDDSDARFEARVHNGELRVKIDRG
jgi:hypothetical protein